MTARANLSHKLLWQSKHRKVIQNQVSEFRVVFIISRGNLVERN